jgi:hypothetical protein
LITRIKKKQIHRFIFELKSKWNPKVKTFYDSRFGTYYTLFFDEYRYEWTPVEYIAFEGYVFKNIKDFMKNIK